MCIPNQNKWVFTCNLPIFTKFDLPKFSLLYGLFILILYCNNSHLLPWSCETQQQANDSEFMFLMEVAVKVVVMEGGEMATQTKGHQKPGELVWQLPRWTIGHNPCGVKLERENKNFGT